MDDFGKLTARPPHSVSIFVPSVYINNSLINGLLNAYFMLKMYRLEQR